MSHLEIPAKTLDPAAIDYKSSLDNMGGVITAFFY
jgi:hypothetical protein